MKSLMGRKALITGGSRGIGGATALLFAEYGTHVAIGYRARRDAAEALAARARAAGVEAYAIAADVSTRSGAEQLVEDAGRQLGGIDYFVGNSGIWNPTDVALPDSGTISVIGPGTGLGVAHFARFSGFYRQLGDMSGVNREGLV